VQSSHSAPPQLPSAAGCQACARRARHYDNSGKSGAVKDLRPGMSVTIQGQKQKDGTLRATAVRYDKNAPVQPS